jgi:hypothetical protein
MERRSKRGASVSRSFTREPLLRFVLRAVRLTGNGRGFPDKPHRYFGEGV